MKTAIVALFFLVSLAALGLSLGLILAPQSLREKAGPWSLDPEPSEIERGATFADGADATALLRAQVERLQEDLDGLRADREALDQVRLELALLRSRLDERDAAVQSVPGAPGATTKPADLSGAPAVEGGTPVAEVVEQKVAEALRQRDQQRRERMVQDMARWRQEMQAERDKQRDWVMQRLIDEAFVAPATAERVREALDRRDQAVQSLFDEMMTAGGGMIAFSGDMGEGSPLPPAPLGDPGRKPDAEGRPREAIEADMVAERAKADEELAQLLTPQQRDALDRIQREEAPRQRGMFIAEAQEAPPERSETGK